MASDTSDVRRVTVNGRPVRSTSDRFAESEIALDVPADQPLTLTAGPEDIHGHVEPRPHVVRHEAAPAGKSPLAPSVKTETPHGSP